MLFFNFIILLLDPDPDPAGSEKVGSVTSLIFSNYYKNFNTRYNNSSTIKFNLKTNSVNTLKIPFAHLICPFVN